MYVRQKVKRQERQAHLKKLAFFFATLHELSLFLRKFAAIMDGTDYIVKKKTEKAMPQEQSQIRERQKTNLREPRRYKVIIHNDDFTTMEFVVMILKEVFFLSEENAQALMLQVHHSDKAVVGIYTYDIALSKAQKATKMARENGFPLRLTVEPEDN